MRRTKFLVAAAAAAVLTGAVLAPTSAPAAPTPSVTIDPATLPPGPPPNMPYFDAATEQIRDGARVVDLTGLKKFTQPTQLWKVNGGYVLDRNVDFGRELQLLFVDYRGRGKVLSRHLSYTETPVVVSSQYGRVVYMENYGSQSYLAVNDVPSGKLVSRRSMPGLARPVTYRGRVLVTHVTRGAFYWKPGVSAVQYDPSLKLMVATSLRAGQTALREDPVRIAPFPFTAGTGWTDPELNLWEPPQAAVVWSPDGTLLAGSHLQRGNDFDEQVVHLRQADDGTPVLDIHTGNRSTNGAIDQVWWETPDTVIINLANPSLDIVTVRCTTAGVCNRIGPFNTEFGGKFSVVPATRNVS